MRERVCGSVDEGRGFVSLGQWSEESDDLYNVHKN